MARFTSAGGGGGEPGAPGADGADALWSFEGEWVNGVDYAPGSVVQYQGSSYYHPNGQFSSYNPPGYGWLLVSAKGEDGDDGATGAGFGIFYLGNYNPSSGYVPDIAVVRGSDGQLYLAKASGQLNDPVGNTAQWEVWIPKGADGAPGADGADGSAADTGQITFLGVYIIGSGAGSGDGAGNGTIKLLPDGDLIAQQNHEDQYLIIDPTSPNHIHIRAGGVQDASAADLFLGAERTGVQVSDASRSVVVRSKKQDQALNYGNSNGTSNSQFIHASDADIIVGDTVRLYTGGDIFTVTSVTESEGAMTVVAEGLTFITGETYTFFRSMGEDRWMFQTNGITFPNNSVQTTAFVGGATGTFTSQDNKTVTVTNGIITSIV